MTTKTVAALQIGSSPEGRARTLEDILAYEGQIAASGASLVVMPEALLGGYPKGEIFGTRLATACPKAAKPTPAITTTPSMCPVPKPRRSPPCRSAPEPAWWWA